MRGGVGGSGFCVLAGRRFWRRLTLVQPSKVPTLDVVVLVGLVCGGTLRGGAGATLRGSAGVGNVAGGGLVVGAKVTFGGRGAVVNEVFGVCVSEVIGAGSGIGVMVNSSWSVVVVGVTWDLPSRLRRMLLRVRRVATSLSESGASGDPGDGCSRACRISWIPAVMMFVEEASGMVTWVGNQVTVSAIRSRWVVQIQAR